MACQCVIIGFFQMVRNKNFTTFLANEDIKLILTIRLKVIINHDHCCGPRHGHVMAMIIRRMMLSVSGPTVDST